MNLTENEPAQVTSATPPEAARYLPALAAATALFGIVADRFSLQAALALPALCYVYVVFYGLRGSRHGAKVA